MSYFKMYYHMEHAYSFLRSILYLRQTIYYEVFECNGIQKYSNINPKRNIVPSPMFLQPKTISSVLQKNPQNLNIFSLLSLNSIKWLQNLHPLTFYPMPTLEDFFRCLDELKGNFFKCIYKDISCSSHSSYFAYLKVCANYL